MISRSFLARPPARQLVTSRLAPQRSAVLPREVEEEVGVGETGIAVASEAVEAALLPVPGEVGEQ